MDGQGPRVREIRVHGVSGTPPHAMLGVHDYEVVQISGDDITGLYTCRPGSSPKGVHVPPDVSVVAYSWGALTSGASGFAGAARRALWLTLLPFALGNLAYWGRPELDNTNSPRAATAIVIREACLVLTLLFTAALCVIGIDMVGWQCFRGGTMVCPSLPSQLGFLARPPFDAASVRLLIGSVLPFAALGLLWWLSKTSLARYEAHESAFEPTGPGPVLQRRRMWAGDRRTARLQRLHIGAGLLLVVMFGLVPVARYAGRGGALWLTIGVLTASSILLALTALAVGVSYRDGIDFPGVHLGFAERLSRLLPWLALVAVAMYVGIMVSVTIPERFDDPGLTAGRNTLVGGLLLSLFAMVAWLVLSCDAPRLALMYPLGLLAVIGLAHWVLPAGVVAAAVLLGAAMLAQRTRRSRRLPRVWHGAGAAMILGAAVWIAALFTTSLVVFVGNWLNGSQTVTELQSEFVADDSPGAFAARVQQTSPLLYATGPVVVRDAILERSGPDFYVLRSGLLTASSVSTADGEVLRSTPDLDLSSGMVLIDDPPLQVINGCITDPGAPCSSAVDTWINTVAGPIVIGSDVSITVSNRPQEPLVVPAVLIWFSGLTVVWGTAVVAIVGLALIVSRWRSREAVVDQVDADAIPADDRRRSVRARLVAVFIHRAERLLALAAVATSACGLGLAVGVGAGWQPWRTNAFAEWITNAGLGLAVFLSGALILLVGKLLNTAGVWRAVGVLWDLTTFWPRVAHPLGPPCYAERVVPEIVDEVMTTPAGTRVILSGHSQGSLIGVAVLSQLAGIRGGLSSMCFVSYGSQLRTWYGRIFPGVLGAQVIGNTAMMRQTPLTTATPDAPDAGSTADPYPGASAQDSLAGMLSVGSDAARWVTLFRRTDPIGFRVFSDQTTDVDRYVSEYDPDGKALYGHSDYQFSQEYAQVVQGWYGTDP